MFQFDNQFGVNPLYWKKLVISTLCTFYLYSLCLAYEVELVCVFRRHTLICLFKFFLQNTGEMQRQSVFWYLSIIWVFSVIPLRFQGGKSLYFENTQKILIHIQNTKKIHGIFIVWKGGVRGVRGVRWVRGVRGVRWGEAKRRLLF